MLYYVSIVEGKETVQKRAWADSAQKAADKIREIHPKATVKSVARLVKCDDWK